MTRKRKRLYLVLGGLALFGTATGLVLSAFSSDLVFFYSPSELAAKHIPDGRYVRIGGLVQDGSIAHADDGLVLDFRVTDGKVAVPVTYKGAVPDLFRAGQGVVVEGEMEHGTFRATTLLAKHDERYMPRNVVDALKRTGHWHGDHPDQTAASTNAVLIDSK